MTTCSEFNGGGQFYQFTSDAADEGEREALLNMVVTLKFPIQPIASILSFLHTIIDIHKAPNRSILVIDEDDVPASVVYTTDTLDKQLFEQGWLKR